MIKFSGTKMKSMHLLLIMIIFCIFLKSSSSIKVADSVQSSFPRQEMGDRPNDWEYYPLLPGSVCTDIQSSVKIPDMEGATYFSDNGFLNATIWLSGPFEAKPPQFLRFPSYTMYIGIIQPNNVSAYTNYEVLLQWDALKSTWIRTIQERLSNNTRILEQDQNYTDFFDNTGNKGHITFSLDLRRITSPNQYFLGFLVFDGIAKNRNFCGLVDVIPNTAYVPPPEFSIASLPDRVEIKQGEEKSIELKINSSTIVSPSVLLNTTTQAPQGMQIHIEPNQTNVPSAGVATSHIKIKVPDRAEPGSYTLPIISKISFPNTVNVSEIINSLSANITRSSLGASSPNDNNRISSRTIGTNVTTSTVFPRPSYFTVVVTENRFDEKFKDFWNTYGGVIGLVAGGFAAGLSALLIDRLKGKSRNKSKTVDDQP